MIAFLSMDKSLQLLHRASLSVGFTRAFRVVCSHSTKYHCEHNMEKLVITVNNKPTQIPKVTCKNHSSCFE